MRLAALGVSYERVGSMLGFAKSTLCKWLKQEQCKRPKMSGEVLEPDVVWTRVAGGSVELKVARDERGVALVSAGFTPRPSLSAPWRAAFQARLLKCRRGSRPGLR